MIIYVYLQIYFMIFMSCQTSHLYLSWLRQGCNKTLEGPCHLLKCSEGLWIRPFSTNESVSTFKCCLLIFVGEWLLMSFLLFGLLTKGVFLDKREIFGPEKPAFYGCLALRPLWKIFIESTLHSLIEVHNRTATRNAVTRHYARLPSCNQTCWFNADQPRVVLRHKVYCCNLVLTQPQRAALKQRESWPWCAWGTHKNVELW